MTLSEKLKLLFVPRVVIARLPYVATSIILVMLGFAVRDTGWQWLAWPLAAVAFHASVRPTIAAWALLSTTYFCFAAAQLVTVYQDFRSDAVWAVPAMGALLAFIGLAFYRSRPREILTENSPPSPFMGHRSLPVVQKRVEEENSAE